MADRIYMGKPGSRISNATAERVGSFLDKRYGDSQGVTAAEVVAAARPKRSPIHRDFEWDDKAAAGQYRLQQAEHLLRNIQVTYTKDGVDRSTRAYQFISTTTPQGEDRGAYVAARIVWETPELASQVVERAKQELIWWTNRYREYEELAETAVKVGELAERIMAA